MKTFAFFLIGFGLYAMIGNAAFAVVGVFLAVLGIIFLISFTSMRIDDWDQERNIKRDRKD